MDCGTLWLNLKYAMANLSFSCIKALVVYVKNLIKLFSLPSEILIESSSIKVINAHKARNILLTNIWLMGQLC